MTPTKERQICYQALVRMFRCGGYSSLTIQQALQNNQVPTHEGLVSALFYGVLERDITLSYVLGKHVSKPISKLDVEICVILKMGLYQLLFLNGIPDRAAVDESVKLCTYARKTSAKGLVNAVLRSVIRAGKQLVIDETDPIKAESLRYSCPEWLVRQWFDEYGEEIACGLLKASLGRPPMTVRVNTFRTSTEMLMQKLSKADIQVKQHPHLADCLELERTGNIEDIPEFAQGYFYVQDAASQFCAKLVDAQPGMTVFDVCAAPGSKSFTIAQYMKGIGTIFAMDQYRHRLALIEKGAEKLGIPNIVTKQQDAAMFDTTLPQADRVLCDVPCAGLGVIRRKPEIKYKDPHSLDKLPQIQKDILENASAYVKPGGKLIYATCSLSMAENENVVDEFNQCHADFSIQEAPASLKGMVLCRRNRMTFLPQHMNSDGFFVAVMRRENPDEHQARD